MKITNPLFCEFTLSYFITLSCGSCEAQMHMLQYKKVVPSVALRDSGCLDKDLLPLTLVEAC